ncbi:MAG TPA: hypothetical protein VNU68_10245, partial [Verrucomicrobiae bacterium]|nr:hypothetical protein [Verrucomicrobiae bacterium]
MSMPAVSGVSGLLAAFVAGASAAQPVPDDWPRYGHDEALTGRSSLTGRITSPRTAWTYQTGGREWLVEIVPTPGAHTLQLDASRAATVAPSRFRPPARPVFDLDGTGTLRAPAENYHERWAKILPDVKGWQRVAWNETWTDQKVCRLQLFAYDRGFNRPRLVWQTDPPEGTIFQPLNLIYDLDGDGVQEICVAAHYRVMIFEGTTGRKETELRYHQSRPYGWFGLANVDATGPMELITIGDFQSHIDVLNYDPAKPEQERLSVRWRRDIEQAIEDRTKWPQVGPHPVADVAGDARLELVLNLFNDTGDGQWHAVVLDASTGIQVQDFPRRFLQGTVDIDGDGKAELFLASTEGVLVPAFGIVELVSLRPAGPVVRWSQENAAWGCADLPRIESTWSTTASQGMRDILVSEPAPGDRPTFLVSQRKTKPDAQSGRSPAPSTTLRAMSSALSGVLVTNWEVTGLPDDFQFVTLSKPADRAGIGVTMRMKVSRDTVLSLDCQRAEAQVTESQPLGVPVSTPIAARLRPDGLPVVVVEGAAREIFALQADKTGTNAPQVLWRRPGRGMGDGSRWLGPLAADLDGDNGKEIVVATADAAGRAMLVAYRHDGSVLWQARFDQIPGATPVWNLAALTFWWPGCFRTNGQIDLFVNTRRGPMHSDIGQLLDGRTGALIWRQDKAALPDQFSWGYAGIPPAVSDVDDDGSAELISLYPVCFWVADGRTGRLKQGVELASRKRLPAWAAYGEPMIYSFTGQKNAEVLLDSQYILGLLDIHGAPLWHAGVRPDFPTSANDGSLGQTTQVKHALIDFDGDGVFEIGSAGYGDGVRAIDPRNGQTLWSLPAPSPTCA